MQATRKEWRTDGSRRYFEQAGRSLAGGVGSAARSTHAGYSPYPLAMHHGDGARIYDVDGNEYIDYLLALGPLILGHRPIRVTTAVREVLEQTGSMLGTNHPLEAQLAEEIRRAVDDSALVRFSNSGTEAVMIALRLARAFTGKQRVVRFEGHFHGWAESIQWSVRPALEAAGDELNPRAVPGAPGIPECLGEQLIVLPWNRPDLLEQTLQRHHGQIAAVISEPLMANNGCIEPLPGFLQTIRDLTARYGVLFILDEVITGFRLAYGGAQEYYDVKPDLSVFAKALGAGYPISAVVGRSDIMNLVATNTVPYLGTYNSNSLVMAAAIATLEELRQPDVYRRLHRLGEKLATGLRHAFRAAGIPATIQGPGPVFQIWFSETPATNYREAVAHAKVPFYKAFHQAMLRRGILFHPHQHEHFFISAAHTSADVDRTIEEAEAAVYEIRDSFVP